MTAVAGYNSGAAQDPANEGSLGGLGIGGREHLGRGAPTIHACWDTRLDDVTVAGPTITALTPYWDVPAARQ